jgi:hypothetical protein
LLVIFTLVLCRDLHGNAFSGTIPGFPASSFSFLQAL